MRWLLWSVLQSSAYYDVCLCSGIKRYPVCCDSRKIIIRAIVQRDDYLMIEPASIIMGASEKSRPLGTAPSYVRTLQISYILIWEFNRILTAHTGNNGLIKMLVMRRYSRFVGRCAKSIPIYIITPWANANAKLNNIKINFLLWF